MPLPEAQRPEASTNSTPRLPSLYLMCLGMMYTRVEAQITSSLRCQIRLHPLPRVSWSLLILLNSQMNLSGPCKRAGTVWQNLDGENGSDC